MKKIYAFINGGSYGFYQSVALSEDGYVLAKHVSKSETWAKHDLGIGSDWKHEHYDQHFGAGNWCLEWVDDPAVHTGLKKALERNRIMAAITVGNTMTDTFPMWVIYERPRDFPDGFIVRRWDINGPDPIPGPAYAEPTLEAARRHVPPGLVRLPRFENDEPHIVEAWL